MPEQNVQIINLQDIQVRGLNGFVKRRWAPRQIELSITNAIGIDTDDNRAKVEVDIELVGWNEEGEDVERVPTYTGSITLIVLPAEDFQFTEDPIHAKSVFEIVWPVARTGLIEHANRLGLHILRLPMFISASDLEVGEEFEDDEMEEVVESTSS